jgi:hypothetical protein
MVDEYDKTPFNYYSFSFGSKRNKTISFSSQKETKTELGQSLGVGHFAGYNI